MTEQKQFETDVLPTSEGDLEITFLGHGSLMMTFNAQVIHIDPFSRVADYAELPAADLILITHEHRDHLDPEAIAQVRTDETEIVLTANCAQQFDGGIVMRNGDERTVAGVHIEAAPAYNLIHKRENGQPFHPQGAGNGYILTFGDQRVYIAGDTEPIPEMKALEGIDCAFLPMNLPYTMSPEMTAEAAKMFRPAILYPYHCGSTDPTQLEALLQDEDDIDVRIRDLA